MRRAIAVPRPIASLVFALVLLLGASPAAVAGTGAAKACRVACKRGNVACLRKAKEERVVRAGACRASESRRACRKALARAFRSGKRTCRVMRSACRRCCRTGAAGCAGEEPLFEGVFPLPNRNVVDALPLPPGPNGTGFTWLPTADGTLVIDPSRRSAISAAAECAAVVLGCFRPGVRNWAGCFDAAPPCPNDTPWLQDGQMCCPAACGARYQQLRQAGLDGPTAMTGAIWDAPSCIPGLEGRSAEAPP